MTNQVILWMISNGSSCISELENSSPKYPFPVGTQLRYGSSTGVVVEGRKHEGFLLHKQSVLVQCSDGLVVWFVPLCHQGGGLRPVPKKISVAKEVSSDPVSKLKSFLGK